MSIYCFHGFLGSRDDFSHFNGAQKLDLYEICKESKEDVLKNLEQTIAPDSILVGYSFGGRLAMQLFVKNPDKYKGCVVISSHCGLKDRAHKMQRVLFDQKCADKVRLLDEKSFLDGWNSQPLFQCDKPIEKYPIQDKNILARFFTEFGLSTQDYLIDDLTVHKDKLHFIYGQDDIKYFEYAKNIQAMGFKTQIIPNCSHRVLQKNGALVYKIARQYA